MSGVPFGEVGRREEGEEVNADIYNVMKSPLDLSPHPLNQKIYGEETPDPDLVESIKNNGLFEPLVIKDSNIIMSGHRRWLAAKEVGLEEVACRHITFKTEKDETIYLIDSNKQRVKTPQQSNNEIRELAKYLKPEMEEKQKVAGAAGNAGAGYGVLGGRPKKDEENPLTPNSAQGGLSEKKPKTKSKTKKRASTALELAAQRQDIGKDTARKRLELEDAANDGDEEAKKQWAKINNGSSTNSCYTAWLKEKKARQKREESKISLGEVPVDDTIKLYQGDCLIELKKLEESSIDLVITDLPYGTTSCAWDSTIDLKKLWQELNRVCKKNAAMVFTAQQPFTWRLCASNPNNFKYELIWVKPNATNPFHAKKMPMKSHENILIFYRAQPTYNPQKEKGDPYVWDSKRTKGEASSLSATGINDRIESDGWRYPKSVIPCEQNRGLHPTQKPTRLMRYLIKTYSNPGDTVLDCTMGSGTTGVAAKETARKFVGIELDSEYFNGAKERIKSATRIMEIGSL